MTIVVQARGLLVAALALALSACAAGPAKPGATASATAAAAAPADAATVQTLEANRWTLVSATDGQARHIEAAAAQAGRPIVFTFAAGRLGIQGGCNPMSGSFQIDAQGHLTVGQMASTMMACEPALMKVDAALAAVLAKPLKVELGKPGSPQTLRLVSAADEMLVLSGQSTPEARYGPGETVFMEVAAQQVPCNHPLMKDAMCLQVRERRFDAQGLAVGAPGAWQPFNASIDGYKHVPGVRNVLRVKRFTRNPAPADASRYVYVLDLVVESEMVSK